MFALYDYDLWLVLYTVFVKKKNVHYVYEPISHIMNKQTVEFIMS